ncbi:MAG: hypothetical protein U1F68_09460 [Gammaproteobacteria bacterium]
MTKHNKISQYLLPFMGWLILFGGCYYVFFPTYSNLVLLLTSLILNSFTAIGVSLFDVPGQGIGLIYANATTPLGFRYDLFSIALNAMFAPALVMTTLGPNANAIIRATIAIAIMILLHSFHVLTIILHFLVKSSNPILTAQLAPWLTSLIHWAYTFSDKMGYTFFPFIAWFMVCFGAILRFLNRKPPASAIPEIDAPH